MPVCLARLSVCHDAYDVMYTIIHLIKLIYTKENINIGKFDNKQQTTSGQMRQFASKEQV